MLLLLLLLGVVILAARTTFQAFYVDGASMLPSLHPGQMLLVNRAIAGGLIGQPGRGDLVVFEAPGIAGRDLVKRVIGLPGDVVLIQDGRVFVNDDALTEPYVSYRATYSYPANGQALHLGPDEFFVLGDNRPESADSHLGWLVPTHNLIGLALPLPWTSAPWQRSAPTPVGAQHPATGSPAADVPETPDAQGDAAAAESTAVTAPLSRLELGPQWDRAELTARQPGQFVVVNAPLQRHLRDATVSASFRKVGGAVGGRYGLILRDQSPAPQDAHAASGEFYLLGVGDRGEFGIWRRDGENWVGLLPWTPSDQVRAGGATNTLSARAEGDHLTLLVNGIEVASLTDATLADGAVGAFVGGDDNDVLIEHFAVDVDGCSV